MERARAEAVIPTLTVVLFFAIALVNWWAALWHKDLYARIGATPPDVTILLMHAVELGVPFVVAAVFSAVIVYEMIRHKHSALLVSATLLCIAVTLSLVMVFAMTAPMLRLCGEFVPGWPSVPESSPSGAATAPGAHECRPF